MIPKFRATAIISGFRIGVSESAPHILFCIPCITVSTCRLSRNLCRVFVSGRIERHFVSCDRFRGDSGAVTVFAIFSWCVRISRSFARNCGPEEHGVRARVPSVDVSIRGSALKTDSCFHVTDETRSGVIGVASIFSRALSQP